MSLPHPACTLAAAVTTALALAACSGDAAGPSEPFRPEAVTAAWAKLESSFQAPVTQSLAGIGRIGLPTMVAAAAPALQSGIAAVRYMPWLVGAAGAALPDSLLGKTLELDCSLGGYAVTARPGAPANGLRVVLYNVDPSHQIACPGVEVGHADVADAGIGAPALRVTAATADSTIYVDYTISGSKTGTTSAGSVKLSVQGLVTDGTTRLDFSLSLILAVAGSQLTGVVDANLDVNASDIHVALHDDLADDQAGPIEHLDFTLHVDRQAVRLYGTNTGPTSSGLSLTVTVNGAAFSTVTGSLRNPTFAGPGGRSLTPDELAAMQAMLQEPTAAIGSLAQILQLGVGFLGVQLGL